MDIAKEVTIISGDVKLNTLNPPVFKWGGSPKEDTDLVFSKAFCIERANWDEGIKKCTYTIHDREFTDLSFSKGELLEKMEGGYRLKEHEDGTKFIYESGNITAFDDSDWEWDREKLIGSVNSEKAGKPL